MNNAAASPFMAMKKGATSVASWQKGSSGIEKVWPNAEKVTGAGQDPEAAAMLTAGRVMTPVGEEEAG